MKGRNSQFVRIERSGGTVFLLGYILTKLMMMYAASARNRKWCKWECVLNVFNVLNGLDRCQRCVEVCADLRARVSKMPVESCSRPQCRLSYTVANPKQEQVYTIEPGSAHNWLLCNHSWAHKLWSVWAQSDMHVHTSHNIMHFKVTCSNVYNWCFFCYCKSNFCFSLLFF